jgi:hypothetical protein
MPQATDELRAYWGGVDDSPALEHLGRAGYILNRDWTWTPPKGVTLTNMPERDYFAMVFLIQEWDYGGISALPPPAKPEVHDDE